MDADLTQHWIGAERSFRDDTLRYSLFGFDLGPLEDMLVSINRRLKRSKALDPGRIQGRLVAALDGVEVLSSFSRCCESCLQRRVSRKDQAGRKFEQIQYYHRAVGCQLIHSPVKPFLALERLRPGEGEETAALRLLARLQELYRNGERSSCSTDHEWLWITTLDRQAFPAAAIRQLAHSRWRQENNGWMDLTKHWAFKHGFLHACKQRPQYIDVTGQRTPVYNRLDRLTGLALASQLRARSKAPTSIRAPD